MDESDTPFCDWGCEWRALGREAHTIESSARLARPSPLFVEYRHRNDRLSPDRPGPLFGTSCAGLALVALGGWKTIMLHKSPPKKPLVLIHPIHLTLYAQRSHRTRSRRAREPRPPITLGGRGRELGARRLLRCSVLKLRLLGFGFVAASDQVTRLDGVHACEHHMR